MDQQAINEEAKRGRRHTLLHVGNARTVAADAHTNSLRMGEVLQHYLVLRAGGTHHLPASPAVVLFEEELSCKKGSRRRKKIVQTLLLKAENRVAPQFMHTFTLESGFHNAALSSG